MFDRLLIPDVIFDDIYQITPDYITGKGINALILDIDNTLVTYDDPEPTESVLKWFECMTKAGISIAFVSNNKHERVEIFNKNLGYFATGKSGKPFGSKIRAAMKYMGTTPGNTALIGDQILTDIWAGKAQGLRSYLVPPIKDKRSLFFRFKRMLEKPFIRKYKKLKEKSEK